MKRSNAVRKHGLGTKIACDVCGDLFWPRGLKFHKKTHKSTNPNIELNHTDQGYEATITVKLTRDQLIEFAMTGKIK